jgi:hypothetical protein
MDSTEKAKVFFSQQRQRNRLSKLHTKEIFNQTHTETIEEENFAENYILKSHANINNGSFGESKSMNLRSVSPQSNKEGVGAVSRNFLNFILDCGIPVVDKRNNSLVSVN